MSSRQKKQIYNERERAEGILQELVNQDFAKEKMAENQTSVEEALSQRPLLQYDNDRTKTRVLFVTNDTTFLNPIDDSLERFFSVSSYFDEMHIMVLRSGSVPTKPVLRLRANIWLYIASAENWWWTPVVAYKETVPKQLFFAGGFRPDVVVALEPFESGLAAKWIGKKYSVPVQMHVRKNFLRKSFKKASASNRWRIRIARYVLKRSQSVRVQTQEIKEAIKPFCKHLTRIPLLPWFNNFSEIANTEQEFDVHDAYPMYEKILLFIGPLDYSSTLYSAIDVLKYVLANPRVGLVVLGDGPIKEECENKFKKLGLQTQVAFPKKVTDVVPYLKTADVLVVTDQSAVADELAMQGAVAGVPSIMTETEARSEIFVNNKNAYVCPDDEDCFINKLKEITHNNSVRNQFITNLTNNVAPLLSAEASAYQSRYRNVIESVFVEVEDNSSVDSSVLQEEKA